MDSVPIIYAYLYMIIRDKSNTRFINVHKLKETVKRVIVKRGGIPRYLVQDILEDLIELNLIERKNNCTYEILKDNCYKRIKQRNFIYI